MDGNRSGAPSLRDFGASSPFEARFASAPGLGGIDSEIVAAAEAVAGLVFALAFILASLGSPAVLAQSPDLILRSGCRPRLEGWRLARRLVSGVLRSHSGSIYRRHYGGRKLAAMRSVVVTGASSGIGWGTVRVLIRQGFRVFGSVRREEDARRLAGEFGSNFTPIIFDITDDAAVVAAAGQVRQALDGERLAGLVNNAGIAVPGPLMELKIDEFRRQLAVNLLGQLSVTQAFLPLLGTDMSLAGPPGRIVMISSVAGRTGVAFLGPYAASKHALEGMSKSLRQELMLFGIDVVVVAPGSVATPIWDKAEAIDLDDWRDSPFIGSVERLRKSMVRDGRAGLPPEAIGETVHLALTAKRPKPRYTVARGGFLHGLLPLVPQRLIDRVLGKALGLSPKRRP